MVNKWVRILLAVMGAMILLTSVPAYFMPGANPELAGRETLDSLSLSFLNRQLAIGAVAIAAAWMGSGRAIVLGAVLIFVFTLLDAAGLLMLGENAGPRVANSLVFLALSGFLIWKGIRTGNEAA